MLSASSQHLEVVNGIPVAASNGLPLVGLGVGNQHRESVAALVALAIQDTTKTRLIDTAHITHAESEVAQGILHGVQPLNTDQVLEVHVITKVWHTHLGYERTKLSVLESLQAFTPVFQDSRVDLKLHILLHWPRCYESIDWMDCTDDNVDEYVKQHPRPTAESWKESWRALEELVQKYPIASIGVSNFHLQDLQQLQGIAKVQPSIVQVNLWSLIYDSHLIQYCHDHGMTVQVYSVLASTIADSAVAPRAYHHLQRVALDLSTQLQHDVSVPQVILAWLIQHGVAVIPKSSTRARLAENSATALVNIPSLSDAQVETVAHAVEAYLSGDDVEHDLLVSVSFEAVDRDSQVYWLSPDMEELEIGLLKRGQVFNETTYPGHAYRCYDATNKKHYVDHKVTATFGEHERLRIQFGEDENEPPLGWMGAWKQKK